MHLPILTFQIEMLLHFCPVIDTVPHWQKWKADNPESQVNYINVLKEIFKKLKENHKSAIR